MVENQCAVTNKKSQILVSICCITYNHASFIRKALDGFLMQLPPSCVPQGVKMSNWCEILIHDDCSTDGTTEIIKEYASKYPDLIFPLYEIENQYSKGHVSDIDMYNYLRAKGKYIAYCEGDDYWTNPLKLQKQIDFLESHLEYSICMHGCSVYNSRSENMRMSHDFDAYEKSQYKKLDGMDFSVADYFKGNFGQPLTMVFRLSMFDFNWYKQYKYYRDTHEIYHLLRAGRGYWMNFDGGVYNQHGGGISSSIGIDQSCMEEREHIVELYLHNRKDKELRNYLKKILLWNHDVFRREGREIDFNAILKSYFKRIPYVVLDIYWVLLKRAIKRACMR